jgi:enoyl-[acyl-carrier-protein] reductase (NADH)
MQNSKIDKDEFFINIIQKTPNVEHLVNSINIFNTEEGEDEFLSIDEVSIKRTLHMQCFGLKSLKSKIYDIPEGWNSLPEVSEAIRQPVCQVEYIQQQIF